MLIIFSRPLDWKFDRTTRNFSPAFLKRRRGWWGSAPPRCPQTAKIFRRKISPWETLAGGRRPRLRDSKSYARRNGQCPFPTRNKFCRKSSENLLCPRAGFRPCFTVRGMTWIFQIKNAHPASFMPGGCSVFQSHLFVIFSAVGNLKCAVKLL